MLRKKELTDEELKLMTLELNLKMLTDQVELMERHMQKLDEVYYHIFPDRLSKDLKFRDQLMELMKNSPISRKK
jgi:hypothetical protein